MKACPQCGHDNTWPPKDQPAPRIANVPSKKEPRVPGLDLILMDPGTAISLALFALIGFSLFAIVAWNSSSHEELTQRIQSGKIAPRSLRVMAVRKNVNSLTADVGEGQNMIFRRDLPSSIPVSAGDVIEAYEDRGNYFVPAWENDGSRMLPWIILGITVAPFVLAAIYVLHRFRTVCRETVPQVSD
jgi:hypothetical protein